MLKDPAKSAAFIAARFSGSSPPIPAYHGLALDIESIPLDDAQPAYVSFIHALYPSDACSQSAALRRYSAVATGDSDLKAIAANSDGIVLMNYDQHQTTSDPGPIASQTWFVGNLERVLKIGAQGKNHLRAWATTVTTGR